MSASVRIFGVNCKKIVEDHPGHFKNSQEVSIEELSKLFYESIYEKVYDGINCGLELFFENGIKRDCFTINLMMLYFFSSFSWDDEIELEQYNNSDYKLNKSQVVDLIDWYIALTYVFTDYKDRSVAMKEPKYLEEAKVLIDYFKNNPDENFFQISMYDFVAIKEEVLNAHYDYYFYTYSY
jgi:hypothetical protein